MSKSLDDQQDIKRIRANDTRESPAVKHFKSLKQQAQLSNYGQGSVWEERRGDSDKSKVISEWVERQSHYNPAMVRLEPQEDFDPCIKGTVERINLYVLCYDELEIILMLENKMGMTRDEAEEHLEYNIKGSSMGEDSPVFFNQVA